MSFFLFCANYVWLQHYIQYRPDNVYLITITKLINQKPSLLKIIPTFLINFSSVAYNKCITWITAVAYQAVNCK